MITRARRPMTLEEVRETERLENDSREALGCYLAFVAGVGIFAALGAVSVAFAVSMQTQTIPDNRFLGTIAVVAAACAVALFGRGYPWRETDLAPDRAAGEVELVHVHASTASQARDHEAFFFDVGDGAVMVVRGPATRASVRAGRFPNRYFTLVRLPQANKTLRIECHGEPLPARDLTGYPALDMPSFADGALVAAESLGGWRP